MLVVDVGGATTDVYSAVSHEMEASVHAVALPPDRRTVEGDLGMRVSAPGVVAEAAAARLIPPAHLEPEAKQRHENVAFVPSTQDEHEVDLELARLAVRARGPPPPAPGRGPARPRGAGVLVLSGGVFRHASDLTGIEAGLREHLGPVLRHAEIRVDRRGLLGPAGLLTQARAHRRRGRRCCGRSRAAGGNTRSSCPGSGSRPAAIAIARSHSGSAV